MLHNQRGGGFRNATIMMAATTVRWLPLLGFREFRVLKVFKVFGGFRDNWMVG